MNLGNCLKSWKKLKIFKAAFNTINEVDFWKEVLVHEEFKELQILLETYLALPLSTVECERVFSRVNLIKTDARNTLGMESLNDLLQINLKGPNIEEFDFGECINDWKLTKYRRFI